MPLLAAERARDNRDASWRETVLFTAGITGELWQLDLGRPALA